MMQDRRMGAPDARLAGLEDCVCPLCGSGHATATPYAQPPFKVCRCADCRLWYLSPRLTPSATRRLYENDDYFGGGDAGYDDYRSQERSLRATFRLLLRRLARSGATGGTLLEVGSGLGYLLDEARSFFEARTGIDLSPAAAREAAARAEARVVPGLEALDPSERFDCIIATHVIEHIHKPVPFVASLADRLRPGGALVLAAPDMGGALRRLMGRRWPSFKYPEHVTFFDGDTLARLMLTAGLTVVGRLPYPHAFPASLILGKLGLPVPDFTTRLNVMVPATTVCCIARRPETTP